VLSQHRKWLDRRHLKTLAWMMVGLIESGMIGLTTGHPSCVGVPCTLKAAYAVHALAEQ